jgi:CyaY protein
MDETQFNALAEAAMAEIEKALEQCAAELDYEVKPGGVLEVEFDDGSKVIINRHSAAREIWVAARSGGFHFREDGGRWVGTRGGEDLFAVLSRVLSEQSGETVELRP